jgi:glycolate oxidase FAD binding subunit
VNWPDSPTGGRLGDDRFATVTDRPESVDALRQAVTTRAEEGLAVYPQGGQTALDYGGPPRRPGVALDVRALDQVIDYPAADMTITIQAGMTLGALAKTLAEANQRLPLDAPFPDRATLGGVYATNTSGPRRFGAGRPRDLIIGASFVTAAGELVKGGGRVVKNVAGYDLPKLLTGSMGTLGVIVQMTLKVRPRPEASALAWVPFEDPVVLANLLDALNTSGTRPMAVEVVNGAGASLGAGVPGGPWNLVLGYEDNAASVDWQVDRLRLELGEHARRLVVFRAHEAAPVWEFLIGFPALEAGPLTFVANLRPSAVMPFCTRLDPAQWAVQCHAGNGIVHAHWLGETMPEFAPLRSEAVRVGGNLILSRCPTEHKARLGVWGEPRGDWVIMEKIKQALDPKGILNPGRFVGTI